MKELIILSTPIACFLAYKIGVSIREERELKQKEQEERLINLMEKEGYSEFEINREVDRRRRFGRYF